MDERWAPTWPAEIIDWPDFGLPPDGAQAAAQIREAFARARVGQIVEVGCLGGLGRTGTVLACMAVLAGARARGRRRLGARELSAWRGRDGRSGAMGRLVRPERARP